MGRRMGGVGGLNSLVSRDSEAFRSWKCRNQQGSPGPGPWGQQSAGPQKLRASWLSKGTGGENSMQNLHSFQVSPARIWESFPSLAYQDHGSEMPFWASGGMGGGMLPPNST